MNERFNDDLILKIAAYGFWKQMQGKYGDESCADYSHELFMEIQKMTKRIPMSEEVFWKQCWETIEKSMVGNCGKCPFREECESLPDVEDGGEDCASFLRRKYDERWHSS